MSVEVIDEAPATRVSRGPRRPRAAASGGFGYAIASPYLISLFLFGIFPTGYALYLSFVADRGGQFAGVWNYINVVSDYRFLPALANVMLYLLFWLPFMFVIVLLIAFLLQARPGRFSGSMKLLYYLPGAFTGSAAVLLWIFILDPQIGPFSWLLGLTGAEYISDIVTTSRLPFIFALMAFTAGAGGWIVIMYGALNGVGNDVIESARIDGANRWQLATRIQLPLMRKYTVYMLVLTFAAAFQIYAEPQIINPLLRVGSTAQNSGDTWSLMQLALKLGVQEGKVGQSSALALIILVIGVLVALILIFKTDFFDSKELGK